MTSLRGIRRSGIPCDIFVRRDGEEALAFLLDSQEPLPSVVVMYYCLTKRTGLHTLMKLREHDRTRSVPVAIVVGEHSGIEFADCYQSGANSCVVKQTDPEAYNERLALVTRFWLTVNQDTSAKLQD